jgi:hypothetical protein
LGRWPSTDPMLDKFPNISPYNAMGNSPVMFIDPDGQDIFTYRLYEDGRVALISTTPSNTDVHTVTYRDARYISSGKPSWALPESAHKKYYITLEKDYATAVDAFSANKQDFMPPYHGKDIRGTNTVEHFTMQGISNIGEEKPDTESTHAEGFKKLFDWIKDQTIGKALESKTDHESNPVPLDYGESINIYEPPTSEQPVTGGVTKAPVPQPIVKPPPPKPKTKIMVITRKKPEGEIPTLDDEPIQRPFVEDRPGPSLRIKTIHEPYTLGTIEDLRREATNNPRNLDDYD